jgi:hypothetical protein
MGSGQRPILLACRGWAFGFAPAQPLQPPCGAGRGRGSVRHPPLHGGRPRATGGTGSLARESSAVAGANVRRRLCVAARQLLGGTAHERAGLLDCLPFHLNRIRPCRRLVTVRRSENLVQGGAAFLDAAHCRRPAVGASHPDRLAARGRAGRRGGLAGRRRSKPTACGFDPRRLLSPATPQVTARERLCGGDGIRYSPWSCSPPRSTVGATALSSITMQRRVSARSKQSGSALAVTARPKDGAAVAIDDRAEVAPPSSPHPYGLGPDLPGVRSREALSR